MAIKDIVTLVEVASERPVAAEIAVDMAARLDAHVTGLSLAIEPLIPSHMVSPIPAETLSKLRSEVEGSARAAGDRFKALLAAKGARGTSHMVRALAGTAVDVFASEARLTDLLVMTHDDGTGNEPMRTQLIEHALFDLGRPLLLVPHEDPKPIAFKRAMVAWDDSRTAARAVHAALPLLDLFEHVDVVTIEKGHRADQGETGADLATYLSRHGLDVDIVKQPIHGTVTQTLLAYAHTTEASLIVMGGYGHSRMREFVLGGATRGMLKVMNVPVLMAH